MALGTQRLLHTMKAEGHLPRLSDRIGFLARTNSESILGSIARDDSVDYTQGVAITSSFHPDEHTHIEPVRYGKGSNSMSLMQTVLTDGGGPEPRWKTWLKELWREKRNVLDLYDVSRVRTLRKMRGEVAYSTDGINVGRKPGGDLP